MATAAEHAAIDPELSDAALEAAIPAEPVRFERVRLSNSGGEPEVVVTFRTIAGLVRFRMPQADFEHLKAAVRFEVRHRWAGFADPGSEVIPADA